MRLSSSTRSTELPLALSLAATDIAAGRRSSFRAMTMSSLPETRSGTNPLSISSSMMTMSPKPKPVAGMSLPPRLESSLS